jgi:hypothetical protein
MQDLRLTPHDRIDLVTRQRTSVTIASLAVSKRWLRKSGQSVRWNRWVLR